MTCARSRSRLRFLPNFAEREADDFEGTHGMLPKGAKSEHDPLCVFALVNESPRGVKRAREFADSSSITAPAVRTVLGRLHSWKAHPPSMRPLVIVALVFACIQVLFPPFSYHPGPYNHSLGHAFIGDPPTYHGEAGRTGTIQWGLLVAQLGATGILAALVALLWSTVKKNSHRALALCSLIFLYITTLIGVQVFKPAAAKPTPTPIPSYYRSAVMNAYYDEPIKTNAPAETPTPRHFEEITPVAAPPPSEYDERRVHFYRQLNRSDQEESLKQWFELLNRKAPKGLKVDIEWDRSKRQYVRAYKEFYPQQVPN